MPKKQRDRKKPTDVFKQRLQYACDFLFGGKYTKFAAAVGYEKAAPWFGKVLYSDGQLTAKTLEKILRAGVINAEYLMCGTGPMCAAPREHAPGALALPETVQPLFQCFDTGAVQFAPQITRSPPNQPAAGGVDCDALFLARAIHAARAADKPVILHLNEDVVLDGCGPAVAQMLQKRYVTAVVCTTAAAYRDIEFSRYGGFAPSALDNQLIDINDAALLAANNGLGYGEALGRWCFPVEARTTDSFIATAYALGVPVTVLVSFGDSLNHWFPSKRGAELGAALGAAGYTDLLIFAEQLKRCVGAPCGVFIPTDSVGIAVLDYAAAAIESTANPAVVDVISYFDVLDIREKQRRTFPALLSACDAVYDGKADNAKRSCRV